MLDLGRQPIELDRDRGQFLSEAGGIGLEVGDDAGVEQLTAVALHRPATFAEDRSQPACPLAQLLDAHQPVADVVLAAHRELALDRHHGGVESRQLALQLALELVRADLVGGERLQLGAQTGDLAAGHVDLAAR